MGEVARSVVFFGVAETVVDQTLEHLADLGALPARCVVFGANMPHLGALCAQWEGSVDVTTVFLPEPDLDAIEAAELIVENEGIAPASVVWVAGSDADPAPTMPVHSVLNAARRDTAEIAQALAVILTDG